MENNRKIANNYSSLNDSSSLTSDNNSNNSMTPGGGGGGGGAAYLNGGDTIDKEKCRYPHSIVWTPIPLLTWLCPIIGHMGICTTMGIIRDFAGPYFVSEDDMAFGNPTKYWQLDLSRVPGTNAKDLWDRSVHDASEEYKGRMHNLCCDNCHSHVAYALNAMRYDGSNSWNMVKLCFLMLCHGKYISFCAFLKTWLPFLILVIIAAVVVAVVLTV